MNGDTILKLKNFCKDSLTLMGADVSEDTDGVLSVNIPSGAIDLFEGRSTIRLAFKPEQVDDGIELVVPESYVLARLLESIQQRGELTSTALKPLFQASPAPGIKLANAAVRFMSSDSSYRDLLFANFRVSIVSDENQDKLFSVIIDMQTGEPSLVDPKYILESLTADAPTDKINPSSNPEKAYISAKKAAECFAREWAAAEQQKIDIRFQSEISRLDAYYKEMKSDVGTQSADTRKIQIHRNKTIEACEKTNCLYDTAKEFIETTNNEDELTKALNLKLNELKKIKSKYSWSFSNNYNAIADIEAQMSIVKKSAAIAQKFLRSNKADNKLIDLEEKRQKALTAIQKQAEIKESIKFDPENLQCLQKQNEQLDSEKAQRITELQDKFQLKVVTVPVSLSLIRLPYMQYNYDAIAGSFSIPFSSHHDLIADKIQSPKCQSCAGEITIGYACSCGNLTCESCHKSCLVCGKDMCSKCLSGACQICGGALCDNCRITCEVCGKLACQSHSGKCKDCGKIICKGSENACDKTCQICGNEFCTNHITTCPICSSTVCKNDMNTCAVCGLNACSVDVVNCPSCSKAICSNHSVICKICGQRSCSDCIDTSGYCKTCERLFPASSSQSAIEQIMSGYKAYKPGEHKHWLISESSDSFILVDKKLKFNIYVVKKSTGCVHSENRLGFIESIRLRLRLRQNI